MSRDSRECIILFLAHRFLAIRAEVFLSRVGEAPIDVGLTAGGLGGVAPLAISGPLSRHQTLHLTHSINLWTVHRPR